MTTDSRIATGTATEITAGTTVDVTEKQAREVAEEARESGWSRPSFAKGLYLGRLDLDLIHPHPQGSSEDTERGEEFLAKLRAVCESLDGALIEREARIPDAYLAEFATVGAFGMKIPESTAASG